MQYDAIRLPKTARGATVLSYPHTADNIKRLPEKLDTLKEKCHRELPLLPVQRRKINVDPASQLTRPNVSPEQPFESWQYWYTPAMLFQVLNWHLQKYTLAWLSM
jgi:hypothetical protein